MTATNLPGLNYINRKHYILQDQVLNAELDVEAQAQLQLQSQHGILPLLKRVIILHSSKLVVLAVFAAAMQGHGAVGWLLIGQAESNPPLSILWGMSLQPKLIVK